MNELSPRWRLIFGLEIPICFGTAVYWTFAGARYVRATWNVAADAGHHALLRTLAGTLFSLLCWFYGRWLLAGVRELRTFRMFQEGLAIGDVLLVFGALFGGVRGGMVASMAWAQAIPAAFWLAVRVRFLTATR